MAKVKSKGDVAWHIPKRKKPIAYTSKATSDLIVALSEQGKTICEVQKEINYDRDAINVLQIYIEKGFGDVEARCFFR